MKRQLFLPKMFVLFAMVTSIFTLGLSSCSKATSVVDKPAIPMWDNENAITTITTDGAVLNGTDPKDNGGSEITARGFVYSTDMNADPASITGKCRIIVKGDKFTATLTGLDAGTTYYVWSYVTNSEGTTYSDRNSFTTLASSCPPQSIMIDGEARDIISAASGDYDGCEALVISCSITDDNILSVFDDDVEIDNDYTVLIYTDEGLNIDIDLANPDNDKVLSHGIGAYIIDANNMLYGFYLDKDGMGAFYYANKNDYFETSIVSGKLKTSVNGNNVTCELDVTFEDGRNFAAIYDGVPLSPPTAQGVIQIDNGEQQTIIGELASSSVEMDAFFLSSDYTDIEMPLVIDLDIRCSNTILFASEGIDMTNFEFDFQNPNLESEQEFEIWLYGKGNEVFLLQAGEEGAGCGYYEDHLDEDPHNDPTILNIESGSLSISSSDNFQLIVKLDVKFEGNRSYKVEYRGNPSSADEIVRLLDNGHDLQRTFFNIGGTTALTPSKYIQNFDANLTWHSIHDDIATINAETGQITAVGEVGERTYVYGIDNDVVVYGEIEIMDVPTSYEIGDIYFLDKVGVGIVYNLANGSGYVMSFSKDAVGLYQNISWGQVGVVTGATDKYNGLYNMRKVKEVDDDFSGYPAFAWIDAMNPANTTYSDTDRDIWYFPAKEEMIALSYNFSIVNDKCARKGIMQYLDQASAFTSTEYSSNTFVGIGAIGSGWTFTYGDSSKDFVGHGLYPVLRFNVEELPI